MIKSIQNKWYKWTERKVRLPISPVLPLGRPGTGYGGWIVPTNVLGPDSICYLVGAGEDVSFDVDIAHRYGCTVEIVDPTPRAQAHVDLLKANLAAGIVTPLTNTPTGQYPDYPAAVADQLRMHPMGLWTERTTLRFYAPADPSHVSHSIVNLQHTDTFIEVPVLRLSELMAQNGHKHIDLLKIDIEGAEYQVLQTVLEDQIAVNILCIEYDESARNHFDGRYMDRIEGSLRQLVEAGYTIVAKEPDCHNYTLVHRNLLP